ncbi:hypothetical protein D9615_010303 [Tricholomella constricta]|uniref:Ribonuclease H1 N-terminal domain-containing protein n=1 Tax=Tricholomella constricta TaxID=117010 RepID=A0A8H5LST0_9AGAR|nr:hypothetical protein D9615_010303 [Tricholomella constricta]
MPQSSPPSQPSSQPSSPSPTPPTSSPPEARSPSPMPSMSPPPQPNCTSAHGVRGQRLCDHSEGLQSAAISLEAAHTAIEEAQAALRRVLPISPRIIARALGPERYKAFLAETAADLAARGDLDDASLGMPALPLAQYGSTSPQQDIATPRLLSSENMMAKEDYWYVVKVGREPGVFRGSAGIMNNVSGISGANPERYTTEQDALDAYEKALVAGLVIEGSRINETGSELETGNASNNRLDKVHLEPPELSDLPHLAWEPTLHTSQTFEKLPTLRCMVPDAANPILHGIGPKSI